MSSSLLLEAGGMVSPGTTVDPGGTEAIVARSYQHPALGERVVVRLGSERLGEAEDLAMEFLGFERPSVSPPVGIEQRRSLGFAAWALVNDPGNARFALELVKQMKAAARKARSKPGHAWDSYSDLGQALGRSARHFLPPFWEEVGRAYKELGNQTYAGRALGKSLEAERVHALESDRARRRDVVLEFVLAGCLSGKALSNYAGDLQSQYPPDEAFTIFRDLCVRRTRGGMAPWASLPREFQSLAKAAGRQPDVEWESWLEDVIEAPAMRRAALVFWKSCGKACQRVSARNPAFAMALLRHTQASRRYYQESHLPAWLQMLDDWGVFPYLWDESREDVPPLGQPVAEWLAPLIQDETPPSPIVLNLIEQLAPRLRREGQPLQLVGNGYHKQIDVDVLEMCLELEIPLADPSDADYEVSFLGWLSEVVDHPRRNQDLPRSGDDERFGSEVMRGFHKALMCRGQGETRGYWQPKIATRPFPLCAAERPGIKRLWHRHALELLDRFTTSGLISFERALDRLESTLWPDTLRLFPDVIDRIQAIDPQAMLRTTLRAGIFDEYGWPAFEAAYEQHPLPLKVNDWQGSTLFLSFPALVLTDKVHAYVLRSDGTLETHELRLPKKAELTDLVAVGDDLLSLYRDTNYNRYARWSSRPSEANKLDGYFHGSNDRFATRLPDGTVYFGRQLVTPGGMTLPESAHYYHDGTRFWKWAFQYGTDTSEWVCQEVDPKTDKPVRKSVPPWFEQTHGGTLAFQHCGLMVAPPGCENSPLGCHNGLLGWKVEERADGTWRSEGIDGRVWDQPLKDAAGVPTPCEGLLRQPGTDRYLPVVSGDASDRHYQQLLDPDGTTVVAELREFRSDCAAGQVTVLPVLYWHCLEVRHEASSRKLRGITRDECVKLLEAAAQDEQQRLARAEPAKQDSEKWPQLLAAIRTLLPGVPDRLAQGLADIVDRARRRIEAFERLKAKTLQESKQKLTADSLVVNQRIDDAAESWNLSSARYYMGESCGSVSGHLTAAAAFLRGDAAPGPLPRTSHLWFGMFEWTPFDLYKKYWEHTLSRLDNRSRDAGPWIEFLEFWNELGLAELPGSFSVTQARDADSAGSRTTPMDYSEDFGEGQALEHEGNRFIVLTAEPHESQPYHILQYAPEAHSASLPGYRCKKFKVLNPSWNCDEIAEWIEIVKSDHEPPLPTAEELQELAGQLGVSPPEIGLLWMANGPSHGYREPRFPATLRKPLGWKATDIKAAHQAITSLPEKVVRGIERAVLSQGLTAVFQPDRAKILQAIARAWQASMPKRLRLDAAFQKRLSARSATHRWQTVNHEALLTAAANPDGTPLLEPHECEFRLDKQQSHYQSIVLEPKTRQAAAVDRELLQSAVLLIAMVHSETPAGDPARATVPALVRRLVKLLEDPRTKVPLTSLYFYQGPNSTEPKPVEWITRHLGPITKTTQDGLSLYEDGLLVAAATDSHSQVALAFHTAELRGEAEVTRLLGHGQFETPYGFFNVRETLGLVLAILSPGFRKLADAISAESLEPGTWPANPLHTAPASVAAVEQARGIGTDAAVLYLQTLALPEPTAANIKLWNGWTAARLKKASAELVAQELVLEAKRARAGRTIFLPGEWQELKAPWLPIESWKRPLLWEPAWQPAWADPFAGPVVIRPFEDLFAAAWQRVEAGDPPRYADVERKRKGR